MMTPAQIIDQFKTNKIGIFSAHSGPFKRENELERTLLAHISELSEKIGQLETENKQMKPVFDLAIGYAQFNSVEEWINKLSEAEKDYWKSKGVVYNE